LATLIRKKFHDFPAGMIALACYVYSPMGSIPERCSTLGLEGAAILIPRYIPNRPRGEHYVLLSPVMTS